MLAGMDKMRLPATASYHAHLSRHGRHGHMSGLRMRRSLHSVMSAGLIHHHLLLLLISGRLSRHHHHVLLALGERGPRWRHGCLLRARLRGQVEFDGLAATDATLACQHGRVVANQLCNLKCLMNKRKLLMMCYKRQTEWRTCGVRKMYLTVFAA